MDKTFEQLGFSGRLITVEGLNGSGKTTQIYLLRRWLEARGSRVRFIEWESPDLLRVTGTGAKKRELLTPTTFCLIHATEFADRYERLVVPLLRAGYLVLTDRYLFSALARDCVRGCPKDWVRSLYGFAARPDMTFLCKARLEVVFERVLDGRSRLRYFDAGMDRGFSKDTRESYRIFQSRLLDQYLAMSTEFDFHIIDGEQTIEAQQIMMRERLSKVLDLSAFAVADSASGKTVADRVS
jgi:dTMP kinase